MLEVVERLRQGESPAGILGVGYKEDGQVKFNPPRPLRPLRELPPKAYHLAEFDAYERVCGRRWAMYTSSLACPYNCSYCTNASVYGRQWNALDPEQVVEETADLVSRYNLELLWIVDDNFLVDIPRAVAIGEGLVRRGVKFEWGIQATTNLVARLERDEVKLLRRAGLKQICMGAESASPKILKLMNKGFQDIEGIHGAAEKCLEGGIKPSYNIIFGYPGEGEGERRETVEFILDVCRRYPGRSFGQTSLRPTRVHR